jgi:hypothetical protein
MVDSFLPGGFIFAELPAQVSQLICSPRWNRYEFAIHMDESEAQIDN